MYNLIYEPYTSLSIAGIELGIDARIKWNLVTNFNSNFDCKILFLQ